MWSYSYIGCNNIDGLLTTMCSEFNEYHIMIDDDDVVLLIQS